MTSGTVQLIDQLAATECVKRVEFSKMFPESAIYKLYLFELKRSGRILMMYNSNLRHEVNHCVKLRATRSDSNVQRWKERIENLFVSL